MSNAFLWSITQLMKTLKISPLKHTYDILKYSQVVPKQAIELWRARIGLHSLSKSSNFPRTSSDSSNETQLHLVNILHSLLRIAVEPRKHFANIHIIYKLINKTQLHLPTIELILFVSDLPRDICQVINFLISTFSSFEAFIRQLSVSPKISSSLWKINLQEGVFLQ